MFGGRFDVHCLGPCGPITFDSNPKDLGEFAEVGHLEVTHQVHPEFGHSFGAVVIAKSLVNE